MKYCIEVPFSIGPVSTSRLTDQHSDYFRYILYVLLFTIGRQSQMTPLGIFIQVICLMIENLRKLNLFNTKAKFCPQQLVKHLKHSS
jgi:hypothetical protein